MEGFPPKVQDKLLPLVYKEEDVVQIKKLLVRYHVLKRKRSAAFTLVKHQTKHILSAQHHWELKYPNQLMLGKWKSPAGHF